MKKTMIFLLIATLIFAFAGCGGNNDKSDNSGGDKNTTSPGATNNDQKSNENDVKTTASIVDNEADFKKAISKEGTWIIATLKDLTFTEDLVLEGDFTNGKKDDNGKDITQRKIALYTQDENRNVTGRFTLTAPTLTINSPMAGLWHGTFVGDIYVSQDNFQLIDQKVQGNIYFTTDSAKSTFKMDETSSVSGKQEVKKP
jgi:hypothetical protein